MDYVMRIAIIEMLMIKRARYEDVAAVDHVTRPLQRRHVVAYRLL